MVIILFNGEHNTVYWRETFCRNSCRKRNILFKKKNSYRQNLRNATNLLSTFESSPTCLFKAIILINVQRIPGDTLKRHVGELSIVDKKLVALRKFCR